ncbi:MAG: phenylalanine--tRNA ligase subunit beta, partial [Desulfovibrionaceae bacterium]|nr:phenylalanine--tRNA ligase subunit beta [Desulfovibrionaceae bacterium]
KMTFRVEKASSLLGVEIKPSLAKEVFQGLGCELDLSVEPWKVLQPSWRPDLTREADLIEEVGRVYGLDNIPPKLPPMQFSLEKASTEESEFAFWRRLRQWGAGLGLNEAINYSFVGEKDLDLLGVPLEGRISIKNPLSAEQNVLRPTVAPGLLQSLKVNLAQGALGIRLFELCHGFSEDLSLETHTLETPYLGLLLCGLRHEPVWPYNEEELDYSDLRGILEHLCLFLHLPKPQFEKLESHPYLLPALEIKINQESLGTLGKVLPKVADFYLAQKPVWLAEINLIRLKDLEQNASLHFKPLSIFPAIKRDVTVIGSETLKVGEVLAEISKLKHPLIEDVALVSSYQPEGSQNKHLSFRLTFRHPSRTLKDSEVDKEKDKIVATLTRVLGVRV